jgi:hypothetical protein
MRGHCEGTASRKQSRSLTQVTNSKESENIGSPLERGNPMKQMLTVAALLTAGLSIAKRVFDENIHD